MIKYTQRLDKAIKTAAWAHEQVRQHRKGGKDIPYIIHPFGVMIIASNVTDNEDVLIACLFHDILEDVTTKNPEIYNEDTMRAEFGEHVLGIVKDVTKDETKADWKERSEAYLHHLRHSASDEAVIVSGADKIHNLLSIVGDYEKSGDALWDIFTTKSKQDQIWWYESVNTVLKQRQAPDGLVARLEGLIKEAKELKAD